MNEQVAELIQQMKDEHGDDWAAFLLDTLEDLGVKTNSPVRETLLYYYLSDWIEKAINAHDALVTALETLMGWQSSHMARLTNPHARGPEDHGEAWQRAARAYEQGVSALAKAKGEA